MGEVGGDHDEGPGAEERSDPLGEFAHGLVVELTDHDRDELPARPERHLQEGDLDLERVLASMRGVVDAEAPMLFEHADRLTVQRNLAQRACAMRPGWTGRHR